MTPPIKQRSAVIAAIVGMWLLASLGVFIVIRTGHWSIFPSDDKSATIAQVGAFYLAFFGAQLPAIAFVAFIISRSAFRHPVLVAGLVTFIYQLVRFTIHVARWPRSRASDIEWWVPVGFDLAGIIVLALLVMVMAWMLRRANKAL
jgi:hypothetical protein